MNRFLQRWLEREKPLFPKLRAIPLFRELNRRELEAVVQLLKFARIQQAMLFLNRARPETVFTWC